MLLAIRGCSAIIFFSKHLSQRLKEPLAVICKRNCKSPYNDSTIHYKKAGCAGTTHCTPCQHVSVARDTRTRHDTCLSTCRAWLSTTLGELCLTWRTGCPAQLPHLSMCSACHRIIIIMLAQQALFLIHIGNSSISIHRSDKLILNLDVSL